MQYRFRVLLAPEGSDRLWVFVPQPEAQDAEALAALIRAAASPLLPGPEFRIMQGSCNKPMDLDLSRQAVLAQLRREQVLGETHGFPWDVERQLVETLLYRSEGDFNRALADYARLLAESLPRPRSSAICQRSAVVLLHTVGHRLPMDAERLGPATWPAWNRCPNGRRPCSTGAAASPPSGTAGGPRSTPRSSKDLVVRREELPHPDLAGGCRPGRIGQRPYLSRTFSEEMHESFVNYLTRIRMNHAREMLKQGLSIKRGHP